MLQMVFIENFGYSCKLAFFLILFHIIKGKLWSWSHPVLPVSQVMLSPRPLSERDRGVGQSCLDFYKVSPPPEDYKYD